MSHSRFQQMLASVPANARKVYDIMPISEGWSYSQLHQEMQRTGFNMRTEVIMACVCSLKDAGLIYEVEKHRFQRSPYKPRPILRAVKPTTTTEEAETVAEPTTITPPARPDALSSLDKIGGISAQLRDLSKTFAGMADELDHLAIDLEERTEKDGQASAQLAQLRATFKQLGLG